MQVWPALKIHFVIDWGLQIKFENLRQSGSIKMQNISASTLRLAVSVEAFLKGWAMTKSILELNQDS